MSNSSRNYRPNKRKGSKPVLTRRTSKNQRKWTKRKCRADRELARAEYFKLKNKQH